MVADAEDVPPITASPIPNCHWLLQFLTAEIYPSSLIQTFLSGDSFGIDNANERVYAAEAVDDVIVMRFRRAPTEQLIDQNAMVARLLRDAMLRDLTSAHSRTLLLGRMTASERVAAFLLEMFERRERTKSLDLPMSRNDIADYLGLTVETVCRTLSTLRRDRVISVPNPHRIELLDRATLEEIGEAQ